MKKFALMGLAALAALGFASCDKTTASADTTEGGDKEVLYSGIVPSADAMGTVYTLKLEFDDDHNYTDGDYTMVESTLEADSVAFSGLKEVAVSYTKGDFRKESKVVDGSTVEYIRLVPDAKDALGTPSACSNYFVVNADQTLTMVNAELDMPVMAENYTLTVK